MDSDERTLFTQGLPHADNKPDAASFGSLEPNRAVSSAGEHALHTRRVTGSIPVPPTIPGPMYRKNILRDKGNGIRSLYAEGLSFSEIAMIYGVNRTSITRMLKRSGVEFRRQKTLEFIESSLLLSTDECVIWPFAHNGGGYGEVRIKGRKEYAHRIVCRHVNGEQPSKDHEAAHSCGRGNDGCINWKHLTWKTSIANAHDRIAHGTAPRGTNNGHAKLTDEDVHAIRAKAGTSTHKAIADEYGVVTSIVTRIINRDIWRHI